MNPLKVALFTLCAASMLAVAPCAIKKFVRPGSSASLEKVTPDNKVAELPVASAPSLLSAKRDTSPAPAVTPEQRPALQVAKLPAPTILTSIKPLSEPTIPAPVLTPTPKPEIPYRAEVARAQELLAKLEFATGKVDGKLGQKTQAALISFQKAQGLSTSGDADKATVEKLETMVAALPPPAPAAPAAEDEPKAEEPAIKVAKPAEEAGTAIKEVASEQPQFVVLKSRPAMKKIELGSTPKLNQVSEVKRIQEALVAAEFYGEEPDGKWGKKTISAMEEFQKKNSLKVTGKPDTATWKKLVEVANKNISKPATSSKMIAQQPKQTEKKSDAPAVAVEKITIADSATTKKLIPKSKSDEQKSAAPATITAEASLAATTNGRLLQIAKAAPAEKSDAAAAVAGKKDVASAAPAEKSARLEVSKPASETAEAAPAAGSAELDLRTSKDIADAAKPEPAAASSETQPKSEGLVIRVDVDTKPEAGTIATPAAISDNIKVVADAKPDPFAPAAKSDGIAVSEDKLTLAKADEKKPEEKKADPTPELEKQLAEAKTKMELVANDSRYEVDKYAPKVLEPVSDLLGKVERDLKNSSADPEASKAELKKALGELDNAKRSSLSKKAQEKVSEIESAYKQVKTRFPNELKKDPLADTMAKIDNGYEAMKADYKKGNYDPIVERGDGFKLAIELFANDAAKAYVENQLDKKSVREKISKSNLKEIEELKNQRKYLEASNLLDSCTKDSGKRKGS